MLKVPRYSSRISEVFHPLSGRNIRSVAPVVTMAPIVTSYDRNTWNVRYVAGESTCVVLRRWSRYLNSLILVVVIDTTTGRTTVLDQAAAHLNVHGALTNCATCIAATEERRLYGRPDNCSALRGRGRWGNSGGGGGGILEKCDARLFL